MNSELKSLLRRREAEAFSKALVEKAIRRAEELNVLGSRGDIYAFVAGYMESAMATVAAESPASLKALKGMVR
jgi:hypothetical protein